MPTPSKLAIDTAALQRLIKEEKSYKNEKVQQEQRLKKLQDAQAANEEDETGNREFMIRQETKGIDETDAMFPQVRSKIQDTIARLEQTLKDQQGITATEGKASEEDITKAQDALADAKNRDKQPNGTS